MVVAPKFGATFLPDALLWSPGGSCLLPVSNVLYETISQVRDSA